MSKVLYKRITIFSTDVTAEIFYIVRDGFSIKLNDDGNMELVKTHKDFDVGLFERDTPANLNRRTILAKQWLEETMAVIVSAESSTDGGWR